MTIIQQDSRPARAGTPGLRSPIAWGRRLGSTPHLVALAGVAALLRLPYFGSTITPDEAGFSLVARQWGHGSSLYGRYWVDRPPLLLELFRLASHVGTPFGIRLMGSLAAATATLFVAGCARSLVSDRAGFWAGAVAAVGFSSPALGAVPVNGELLAAPFIAASLFCWVHASSREGRAHLRFMAASGAAAASAILVKQNMIDGVLFFGVVSVLAVVRRRTSRSALVLPAVAWGAGALAAVVAMLALALSRGSSIGGIWFAMYPFRVAAADTIQGYSTSARLHDLVRLGGLELVTLGPLLLMALGMLVLRHRREQSLDLSIVGPALLVLSAYDVFSIVAGGSYWTHYLVQLVVPTSVAAGIVAARRIPLGEGLAAVVVIVSLLLTVVGYGHVAQNTARVTGRAIADVSEPDDTIVSLFGDADIVQASGLRSDYAYLWSLPARTLDKNFVSLATLMESPDAPTWIVVRGTTTQRTLLHDAPSVALQARYHVATHLCGRIVYVRDDVNRTTPVNPVACTPGS